MEKPDFYPPIWVQSRPDAPIRTLDEAAHFLGICDDRNGNNRIGVLRRIQVARSSQEREEAAKAFRGWIELEGLLLFRYGEAAK